MSSDNSIPMGNSFNLNEEKLPFYEDYLEIKNKKVIDKKIIEDLVDIFINFTEEYDPLIQQFIKLYLIKLRKVIYFFI